MVVNSCVLDRHEEVNEELVEKITSLLMKIAVSREGTRNLHQFASARMSQSDIDDTVKNMILEVSNCMHLTKILLIEIVC